jgi:hypothetical protein
MRTFFTPYLLEQMWGMEMAQHTRQFVGLVWQALWKPSVFQRYWQSLRRREFRGFDLLETEVIREPQELALSN